MEREKILSIRGVSKSFPGVKALDQIDLDIFQGEVHAIVGENGAGKSTLMKILSGSVRRDTGEIRLRGEPVEISNPLAAHWLGVSIIYQEFSLINCLSVAENVFLGRLQRKGIARIDWHGIYEAARRIFERIGFPLDPRRLVNDLSVAEKQMVEIAKALSYDVRILVMDEPSATLTERELTNLFQIVRELRAIGTTIIYISHRLEEIFKICDRVTVMRDGRVIDTMDVAITNKAAIIEKMVGRTMEQEFPAPPQGRRGAEVLRVENMRRGHVLNGISFSLHEGEIVGIAGLVGSRRTELVRAIFGADPHDEGAIFIRNRQTRIRSPLDAIAHGLALLTEDRRSEGLVLNFPLKQNVTMTRLRAIFSHLLLQRSVEDTIARNYVEQLSIKTPSINQRVGNLSGGNQQKVVLGKWLHANADIVMLDEPTRGIDVGAKYEIYLLMNQLASAGKGILMISSELTEVLGMCDRILVMHAGELKGEFLRNEATAEKIMHCAVGDRAKMVA